MKRAKSLGKVPERPWHAVNRERTAAYAAASVAISRVDGELALYLRRYAAGRDLELRRYQSNT